MKKIIWITIILLILISIILLFTTKSKEKIMQISDVKFSVSVTPAEKGVIDEYLNLSGNIMPLSTVNIVPKIPGKIEKIYVSEGDKIIKDQILIKINDDDIKIQLKQATAGYESVKARLNQLKEGARNEEKENMDAIVEQSKVNLENAEKNYNRMKNLLEKESISQQQFDIAKTQYLVAKAQYESVKKQRDIIYKGAREGEILSMEKQVEQLKSAKEMVEYQLSNTIIKSPINGIVTKKFLDENNMCSQTTPILTITQMDEVKVIVNCNEKDIYLLKTGLLAYITLDAYPNETFIGKIFKIGQTVDLMSRTVPVEIRIPNNNYKIKPGMFARVKILIVKKKNVLLIPIEGILKEETGDYVIIIKNGITEKRKVITGLQSDVKIEIKKGLKEGELVVTEGNYGLKSGIPVNIKNRKIGEYK